MMNYDGHEGLARALFEESGDALFLLDPDSDQVLDANSVAQRLTGFPLRALLGRSTADLFSFGGPGGLDRLREVAGKSRSFRRQEGYFLCSAGTEGWVPVSLTVSRLHVKPRTLALLAARDVRGQYAAAEWARQAEAELRLVLSLVPECLWSADLDQAGAWKYRHFSPAVERLTGHPPDFFTAGVHRWWGVIHPDDQARWEKAVLRLRGGHPTEEEYRVVRADGTCRWVREEVRATGGAGKGETLRLDGVISDVTERRQAEERTRSREARLLALLNQSPLPVFLKDRQGRFLYVNPAYAALLGKEPADVAGQRDPDLFPPDLAAR
ncbi:MAG TPA: PAS domain S-box protein, partial [Gemmataceae bacterium]|nr:PAS domain S-box protein [Gemmataceae bacterium]